MKKTLRPLLALLLSLTVLLGTCASAWAAPRGMNWWYLGHNNRFNFTYNNYNNRFNRHNQNSGNQNSGNQNFGNQQYNQNSDDSENGMPFSDVPAWAQKQVAQMYGMGIIKGIGNGLFGSNQSLTRAQFAVLLDREFGLSGSQSSTVTFADVPSSSYYYQYIEAAAAYMDYWNGSNGTYLFHPSDPAMREDVIASMVVAAGLGSQTADTSVLTKFADESSISPNLVNLVAIAVQKGLVTGSQNQAGTWNLYPQQPLTRAEAATLLYRALSYSKVAPGGLTVQNGTSDTIQLSVSSSTASLDQSVEITATVLNSSGQAVSGVAVTFGVNGSATLGSGTVDTNSSGVAQTTVTDAVAQYVIVTASAAGVSNSTTVEFGAATTNDSIQLAVNPQSVSVGQSSTVTATVLNSSGQVLTDVPVTFSVNGSATLGSGTVYTNSSGVAQTTVSDATVQGVTVTASAAGVSNSATVEFYTTTANDSIQLAVNPQSLSVGQSSTVTATVLNSSGQVLTDVPVTFSVNGSATLGSGTVYTNSSGVAQTTVSDTTAQGVTVTASAAGVSNSATLTFTSVTAGSIELTYTPQPVDAGQTATLSATVLNSANQALAGVPVTFSVNGSATLGSGTVDTNSSGVAQTTVSDATAQGVTVTASASGLSTSTTITFNAANAAVGRIELSYAPLPAVAGQQVTVTAAVYNSSGQGMSGVPVTFGVNGLATIGSGPVYTDSSGIAQTTLNDATVQTVTVTADTPGFNASTTVQFTS